MSNGVSVPARFPPKKQMIEETISMKAITGHELAGVVTALGYRTTGLSVGQRVFGLPDWHRHGTLAEYVAMEARNLAPLPGDVDFTVGEPADFGPHRVAGPVPARPAAGWAERP